MSLSINVNSENFNQEVLKSPVPVLLDFWAEWCGPCRMVGPILDQLTEEYSGKIKVCKINVDEENELAGRHGIVSIPTLVIYNNGEIVRQQVGALPKVQIESLFSSFL